MSKHPVERIDTNLHQEGGDVADDEYLRYLLGVHYRMFRSDMGDEAAIDDVIEGKKCGWCTDDQQLLYGEENDAVWFVFGQESEGEPQRFDWVKQCVSSRHSRKSR